VLSLFSIPSGFSPNSNIIFQGRQVILIANDITHKAGSFGTREDVVFKLASEFARKKRIPRLYVAANSGARIGLADSVKKVFRVAFKDPSKPDNGFDFIYVTKKDYESLTVDKERILAVPATYGGKDVYRVTDIIGSEPDLGVENLKGSGLIAGETSVAYKEIFTLTIVLGRYESLFALCDWRLQSVSQFLSRVQDCWYWCISCATWSANNPEDDGLSHYFDWISGTQ
jgi:acetyl-CoA carboxylase carboxyltransferase component